MNVLFLVELLISEKGRTIDYLPSQDNLIKKFLKKNTFYFSTSAWNNWGDYFVLNKFNVPTGISSIKLTIF